MLTSNLGMQAGKALDLPVYFGDAGSPAVLHSLGAHRAACAVITLDTPGANYRSVWALHKHFPNVKSYVRAHDVDHGLNLEKARYFSCSCWHANIMLAWQHINVTWPWCVRQIASCTSRATCSRIISTLGSI